MAYLTETTVTKTASYNKAFGQELSAYGIKDKSVSFPFTYRELSLNADAPVADIQAELTKAQETLGVPAVEMLTVQDIVSTLNTARYAAERAKAQAESFKANGISKPGVLDTPEGQLANMVKTLVAAGQTQENAVKMAAQFLEMARAK